MKPEQRLAISLALVVLLSTVIASYYLITNRQSAGIKDKSILEPSSYKVHVHAAVKGPQAISFSIYGTVQAERSVEVKSAISGTIKESLDLFPGRFIEANEAMAVIDTNKIEWELHSLMQDLDEQKIQEDILYEERSIIQEKLNRSKNKVYLAEQKVKEIEGILEIENELFSQTESLYQSGDLSAAHYLETKAKLANTRLNVLNAKRELEQSYTEKELVEQEEQQNQRALSQSRKLEADLQSRWEQNFHDLDKGTLRLNFPSVCEESVADRGMEVSPGTLIGRFRNCNAVEIEIPLPDHLFHWLYQGKLLKANPEQAVNAVSVQLANSQFPLTFEGAYIKGIGAALNTSSRSLPLLIGRENPTDKKGQAIGDKELKPGMYCAVTLNLCEIPDSYSIPLSCLQSNGSIYYLKWGELGEKLFIQEAKDFSIPYRDEERLIAQFEKDLGHILVITQSLPPEALGKEADILERSGEK